MRERTLPPRIWLRVLLRSFLLQASWNFERMQSLGVLFTLTPALGQLYQGEELQRAMARHLTYFNTHPFLASPVLGCLISLEEKRSRGEEGYLDIGEFKEMIMPPYAAMGDAFFWGGVRPLAACIALFFAVMGSLWAAVVMLVLFNIPHLWFRGAGLLRGYRLGLGIVERIQRRRLPDLAVRLKEGTVVFLGALCAYLTFTTLRAEELPTGLGLGVAPMVLLAAWLARRGFSPLTLAFTAAAVVLGAVTIF